MPDMRWGRIVSYFFHPICMPTWVAVLFIYGYPQHMFPFAQLLDWQFVLGVFLIFTCIPALFFILLRKLAWVSSLENAQKTDRFKLNGVYAVYILLSLISILLLKIPIPDLWHDFMRLLVYTTFVSWVVSRWTIVSFHALSQFAFTFFMFLQHINLDTPMDIWFINGSLLLTGIVVSGRLQLGVHTPTQILMSLLLSVLIVLWMCYK